MPKLLKLVDKNNSVLRKTILEVTDFKDPSLHETIEDMLFSIMPEQLAKVGAPFKSAAGMAANQWGIEKRIFIFAPNGAQTVNDLEVVINPSYVPCLFPNEKELRTNAAYEGCFSVPLAAGMVNRYERITATYYNIHGDKIEEIMEGWKARVFQHETDHLDGKLYDGKLDDYPGPECLERTTFKNVEEMEDFWLKKVKPSRDKSF